MWMLYFNKVNHFTHFPAIPHRRQIVFRVVSFRLLRDSIPLEEGTHCWEEKQQLHQQVRRKVPSTIQNTIPGTNPSRLPSTIRWTTVPVPDSWRWTPVPRRDIRRCLPRDTAAAHQIRSSAHRSPRARFFPQRSKFQLKKDPPGRFWSWSAARWTAMRSSGLLEEFGQY